MAEAVFGEPPTEAAYFVALLLALTASSIFSRDLASSSQVAAIFKIVFRSSGVRARLASTRAFFGVPPIFLNGFHDPLSPAHDSHANRQGQGEN